MKGKVYIWAMIQSIMRKLLFPAALAALLLTACDGLRTQTYEDNLVMPLAEGQADSLFCDISLEYVTGGLAEDAQEAVNTAIIRQAFDLEEPDGSLEEIAVRYRENLIDEYLNENGGEPGGVLTWEDRISGAFAGTCQGRQNYTLSYYSYRGGAHGIQTVSQLVFDRKTGALLGEEDLFADGYEQPVAELLRAAVQKDMQAEDAELLPLVELESVAPNGNFSVGKDGVKWIFQPYEVGPYALGLVMATVPWDQLKPYLK